jgi:hypothetical protein
MSAWSPQFEPVDLRGENNDDGPNPPRDRRKGALSKSVGNSSARAWPRSPGCRPDGRQRERLRGGAAPPAADALKQGFCR